MTVTDIFTELGLDAGILGSGDLAGHFAHRRRHAGHAGARRARRNRRAHRPQRQRLCRLAAGARAARGELVRRFGQVLREHKAALGALVTLECGKITLGRRGRSAGDDRHLRLRRRPLAPALRTHHRLRAAGPRAARKLASAGPDRGSSRRSIFRLPCGHGTPRWRWYAATRCSGNRRRKRRCARSPASIC